MSWSTSASVAKTHGCTGFSYFVGNQLSSRFMVLNLVRFFSVWATSPAHELGWGDFWWRIKLSRKMPFKEQLSIIANIYNVLESEGFCTARRYTNQRVFCTDEIPGNMGQGVRTRERQKKNAQIIYPKKVASLAKLLSLLWERFLGLARKTRQLHQTVIIKKALVEH